MRFIEHIIEPTKLLLAWQSPSEERRTRYIVAELNSVDGEISLEYLPTTDDFINAQKYGFKAYPAFQDINKIHHNVLDAFMRRLPPRTRGDFPQYLEGLRLRPTVHISEFALLGYSGAKLLSDGFSIIHPFDHVTSACELLLEAAGYRHIKDDAKTAINLNDAVSFSKEEYNEATKAPAIRIEVNNTPIGYVNRGLIPTILDWIEKKRITGAWVEKMNGTPGRPAVYLYVQVAPENF